MNLQGLIETLHTKVITTIDIFLFTLTVEMDTFTCCNALGTNEYIIFLSLELCLMPSQTKNEILKKNLHCREEH